MDLRFLGDVRLWQGVLLALVLACAAGWLYRRETRARKGLLAWALPVLRALAVFVLVLLLTGPVLHFSQTFGQRTKVLIFVDGSQSMTATDEQMSAGRKLLAAEHLGWLPAGTVDAELLQAAAGLERAGALAAGGAEPAARPAAVRTALTQCIAELEAALDHLAHSRADHLQLGPAPEPDAPAATAPAARGTPLAEVKRRFQEELLDLARKLVVWQDEASIPKVRMGLAAVADNAARWQRDLDGAFAAGAQQLAAAGNPSVRAALTRFDSTTRWQRLEAALLRRGGLLGELEARHHVEVLALPGPQAQRLWWPRPHTPIPDTFNYQPTAAMTDLSDGIAAELTPRGAATRPAKGAGAAASAAPRPAPTTAPADEEQTVVLLFTDGRHNHGPSPLPLATMLGVRHVPVFTVGYGSEREPPDLAVTRVDGSGTVFIEDRVKGQVTLKDDMPAGLSFTVKIACAGKTVWEKELRTEHTHLRKLDFDFPIKELAQEELAKLDKDVQALNLPLALTVTASPLPGERSKDNNTGHLLVRAVTSKRKLLLIDGRPRWEYRYLRNLFQRDPQWEFNELLAPAESGVTWARGVQVGTFPRDRQTWFGYDLVIFGEVPRTLVRDEELEQIRDFVGNRGGGAIFIDGQRNLLREYANSPLGVLLPVQWRAGPADTARPLRLRLTPAGAATGALDLAADPAANQALWESLRPPHWVAPVAAQPGTEVLLEAAFGRGLEPALVFRHYGAGKVLYSAFDESWRWRFEVADEHHQRYWNQVAKWMMERPFDVRDQYVALGVGAASYAPGETAEIRVRLRDAAGQPMLAAKAEAILLRDGQKAATVKLTADENEGGAFRANSPPLTEGGYEVRVRVEGLPEAAMKAATRFVVQPAITPEATGEMANLTCDEELLRRMAANSGGAYFHEENLPALAERLKPLNRTKTIETDRSLWDNWWWFSPVVVLLTLEWALRKRAGMM